jgi:Immunity protein 27
MSTDKPEGSSPERLQGKWLTTRDGIVPDDVCRIVDHLVREHLVKVATRDEGWVTLFRDPLQSTYWELSYPDSEMQGGGPPTLTRLSPDEVKALYEVRPDAKPPFR